MATKARDHSITRSITMGTKKEKGVSSTSSNNNSQTKSTTNTTSSTNIKASSTQKQVPNYLKPTISSRPESFKYVKKYVAADHDHSAAVGPNKLTLSRRRSFDKPPSPSGQRVPHHQERAVADNYKSLRLSSSFSSKTTSSNSPRTTTFSDRAPKTTRAVKPQALYVKSVKKGTESFLKKEGSSGRADSKSSCTSSKEHVITETMITSTTTQVLVIKQEDVNDHDHKQDQPNLVDYDQGGDQLMVMDNSEDNYDINDRHDQEEDNTNDEINNKVTKPCDFFTVSEELVVKAGDNHDANDAGQFKENDEQNSKLGTEEDHDHDHQNPGDHNHDEHVVESHELGEDNQNKDESCSIITTTNKIIIAGEGDDYDYGQETKANDDDDHHHDQVPLIDQDEDKENNKEVTVEENKIISSTTNVIGDDDNHDQKEGLADDDHNQGLNNNNIINNDKIREGEDNEYVGVGVAKPADHDEQATAQASTAVVKRQAGKKESQAYNDVIEETASKLLEKRKNKVKALVGAFETVIDYESK